MLKIPTPDPEQILNHGKNRFPGKGRKWRRKKSVKTDEESEIRVCTNTKKTP